jgi:hypothetical protein
MSAATRRIAELESELATLRFDLVEARQTNALLRHQLYAMTLAGSQLVGVEEARALNRFVAAFRRVLVEIGQAGQGPGGGA